MHLHGAERAKFLTAEAFYAFISVYLRLVVFHDDCTRRTDIHAFFAPLTFTAPDLRFGLETFFRNLAEKF